MKLALLFLVILIIDIVTWAFCKAARDGDRSLKRPDFIKLRGGKRK